VLAIVAGGMVVFLLALGLVLDTGIGFMNRRDAQNIADLSAMAGTKTITDHYVKGGRTGSDVYQAVAGTASTNGCSGTCTWIRDLRRWRRGLARDRHERREHPEPCPGSQGGGRPPPGHLLHAHHRPVHDRRRDERDGAHRRSADAAAGRPCCRSAWRPPPTRSRARSTTSPTARNGPGNFGWLSWNGAPDANTLVTSICTPNNPELTVPVNVPGAPGKMNKIQGRDCLDKYIADGTTVLIPIWDGSDVGNGSNAVYRIIGFAAFILTARSQPAVDNIQGVFQRYYPLATIPAGVGTQPVPGKTTYFLALVR